MSQKICAFKSIKGDYINVFLLVKNINVCHTYFFMHFFFIRTFLMNKNAEKNMCHTFIDKH